MNRVSHASITSGLKPVAPSRVAASGDFFTPSGRVDFPVPEEMSLAEIQSTIEDFGIAAANAKRAGFDGVELHGAFGYLPDQFLQDGTNKRIDAYGGTVAKRSRFMLDVLRAMSSSMGAERVGVKLSPSNRFYGMFDSDAKATFSYLLSEIDRMQIAYVHMMEPSPGDIKTGTVQISETTKFCREYFRGTIISNGGYDFQRAHDALTLRVADFVSFGTPFIANPDLPFKFLLGENLTQGDRSTFYGEGPGGYIDYPVMG